MQTKQPRKFKALALIFLVILTISGCNTMKAKNGNTVKVDYLGTSEGKVFDTSLKEEAQKAGVYNEQRSYEPLEFQVGAGQMIKGFDKAVVGMAVGEEKTVTIPPEEAYGSRNDNLIKEIPLTALKDSGITPKEGQTLQVMTQNGPLRATVKEVTEKTVTLDFNQELAGKTLTFKIILREIAA